VRQYVLLGAGLDSFGVRQPAFARELSIFELDQPASQALKRRRLEQAGVEVPPNLRFAPADLGREPLAEVLARAGFSSSAPAFFSWLGVTIYLTREANLATLRGIVAASAGGSELVFTYTDQRVLEGRRSARLEEMRSKRAAQGEAWISGFDPTTLAEDLRPLGFELQEDLDGRALAERTGAGRAGGLSPSAAGHFARARVAGA
jgi:methyltransferase (TIGR00027 family)